MAKRESGLKELMDDEPELDMTSMIDVVFLLLIFFMVTMNFRVKEGKLEQRLPKDIGQNAGGKPIDREMVRVRIQIIKATPKKLKMMVVKRKSFAEMFGDNHVLGETSFRIKFVVGNQNVMEMTQKTTIVDKQPETVFAFYSGGKKLKTANRLYQRLKAAHDQFPKQPVIIDPDRSATYAALIIALNACRRVGFEEVRFSGKISAN
ncbi:biopolymer transporter ExbD [bacterium AH-315-M10]|nr:biopolymer transporter ExbD [bacterium AH-315-M10]